MIVLSVLSMCPNTSTLFLSTHATHIRTLARARSHIAPRITHNTEHLNILGLDSAVLDEMKYSNSTLGYAVHDAARISRNVFICS